MIEVRFFGTFEISNNESKLSIDNERSKQPLLLLEYLLIHRDRDISSERLCSALWSDGNSDNPSGALKNLIYRLRGMLADIGRTSENEYILSRRGVYAWNDSIETVIDVEEFDKLYTLAENEKFPIAERMANYSKAIELYKGDFLNSESYEEWVVPICTYYRNIFFDCVQKICDFAMERGEYQQVDIVTSKAITIDPFEEKIQIMKMNALIMQGKYAQALAHYEYVTGLYYRELGVKPSDDIREMYKRISKQIKDIETDLTVIKTDLQETLLETSGAFFCDYEVFKNMYRIEARTVERTGQSVFACLFTLSAMDGRTIVKANRERAMDSLNTALYNSLRRGDIVSRFSATQFVAMLPTLTFENSTIVIGRVQRKFEELYKNKNIGVSAKVMPIDPIG